MNQKSKELEALNVYVQKAKKWELPALRNQCVQKLLLIRLVETHFFFILNKRCHQ